MVLLKKHKHKKGSHKKTHKAKHEAKDKSEEEQDKEASQLDTLFLTIAEELGTTEIHNKTHKAHKKKSKKAKATVNTDKKPQETKTTMIKAQAPEQFSLLQLNSDIQLA